MRRSLPAAGLALVLAAGGAALAGTSVPTTPATPTPYPVAVTAARYATFDAAGHTRGTAPWHWSTAGGNCCEAYVTTTGSGKLLEFGGTQPFTSDDHGRTWQQVVFTTPLVNGEGAMVAGPHGDVFGIGWDPYSGDHLQGVRYTGATKRWDVAEAPLHSPFFDREWITYAQGPWNDGGKKVPFLTLVRGGTATKQVELIATDGVSYTTVSDPHQDVASGGEPQAFSIPVVRNAAADDWQPNPGAYTVPLNAGGVLLLDNAGDSLGCPAARLDPTTLAWHCVVLPFTPRGVLRQDSRGWLTMVTRAGNELTLQTSANGGRSWKSVLLPVPEGLKIESSGLFYDVKVSGKLGQAVVATRADDGKKRGQDLVWRVDVGKAQPRVMTTYGVGRGDLATGIGVVNATSDRFDFPSVALFPDGRIAASFDDSTSPKQVGRTPSTNPTGHSPAVAVLD